MPSVTDKWFQGKAIARQRELDQQKQKMDQQTFDERKRVSQGKRMFKNVSLLNQYTNTGNDKGIRRVFSAMGDISPELKANSDLMLEQYEIGGVEAIRKGVGSLYNQGIELGAIAPKKTFSQLRSAGTREFDALTKDLTPEEKAEAIKIKLGLKGRAVSSAVLSAIESGDIDSLIKAKGRIKEEEKFSSMTGASRASTIDKGFESIKKIDAGVRNIDRALAAIQSGAGVGALEKWWPSIKSASVELDNIRGSMALDVVGATTFGALSKGELDLAKDVALPTGLDTPQLIDYLERKKVAQDKLRSYYHEQIQYLDQGNSVAGFLRMKERQQGRGQQEQINTAQQGGLSPEEQAELQQLLNDPTLR